MTLTADQADARCDHAIDRRRDREMEASFATVETAGDIIGAIKKEIAHLSWLHAQKHKHPHPGVWLEMIANAELNIAALDDKLAALTAEPISLAAE